jgi:glycosyltransferase involved in cell wall biosynthesis
MNVLIAGHGCLPNAGSEPGVTWNWAWHLAAHHDVWVITHGAFRPAIEDYLRDHPRPGLNFIWVGPFGRWDPWEPSSPRGIWLHYLWWRRAALAAARDLIRVQRIDVVHHVSWCTVSAPPLLWKLGKPFVWGPVGGGQTTPRPFLFSFGWGAVAELGRTLRVRLMRANPVLRRTVGRTDLLLSANRETTAILSAAGADRIVSFPDIGVPPELLPERLPPRPESGGFQVLWAGRLERLKGVDLLLDVAARITAPGIRFLVAGGGGRLDAARRAARRCGLDRRISFLGPVPWPELQRLFAEAHLFLFTGLRDTFGSVTLEAMAKGCPVVSLDCGGVGTLPDDAAVKIRVTNPRRVAAEMARAIERLAAERARLHMLSEAAFRTATRETWDKRADAMSRLYEKLVREPHWLDGGERTEELQAL